MTTETKRNTSAESKFLAAVVDGLSHPAGFKSIPSQYLYDERGCELFESICETPEYYLTRTELEIMRRDARAMAAVCGPGCRMIELGCGATIKTRLLLDQLVEPEAYIPVDFSPEYLFPSVEKLSQQYPHLTIDPICADFTKSFKIPRGNGDARTVVYFPGSTIGNFQPSAATRLMSNVRRLTEPDGGVLIGMDLKKDVEVLEAAYNDTAGVTAEFTGNILYRLKRDLGASLDVDTFEHLARYNELDGRIEIYLRSKEDQSLEIESHCFKIAADELIRTEYSYKYDLMDIQQMARESSMALTHGWLDQQNWFGVFFFSVA